MLLQLVPWHCRTVHATYIRVNELCMEVRGHLRKVLILTVFHEEQELKRINLMAMSIIVLKLQLYFRNGLNIFLEFSTLYCQYLFRLFIYGCIALNKQYDAPTHIA